MPSTRTWNELDPDGAVVLANTIDTEVQEFKVDVRERMVDLGVTNFANSAGQTVNFSTLLFNAVADFPIRGGSNTTQLKNAVGSQVNFQVRDNGIIGASFQLRCVLETDFGTIFTTTDTPVQFSTEVIDIGGLFTLVSPTRITIPANGDGSYAIVYTGSVELTAGGPYLLMSIRKNGVLLGNLFYTIYCPIAGRLFGYSISLIEVAAAGDYFELFAKQVSADFNGAIKCRASAMKVA